jgi:hypothetical protein
MTDSSSKNWKSIIDLVSELKRCDECGITTASLAMAYICIDAIANLGRPATKQKATRTDFIEFADTYLKAHSEQPYQYRGKDVYAARCAFLHTYGADAELHEEDPNIIKFVYHDGGRHKYNPSVTPGLVVIGTKSFINDVIIAVDSFLKECERDVSLRARVETRLGKVLGIVPYPSS